MMDTERMIRELRHTADKHKNDKLLTFDTNITALCKDVIPKLEQLKQYETIGTLEECREAREKQQAKRVPDIKHFGRCPCCDSEFNSELLDKYNIEHCPWCGQALDWRGEESDDQIGNNADR